MFNYLSSIQQISGDTINLLDSQTSRRVTLQYREDSFPLPCFILDSSNSFC